MWRCCLNPKVLAGLAAAGTGLWVLSPASIGALFPALVLLICPLSMGVMMWRMRSGASCAAPQGGGAPDRAVAEIHALRMEIADLRANASASPAASTVDQVAARTDRPARPAH